MLVDVVSVVSGRAYVLGQIEHTRIALRVSTSESTDRTREEGRGSTREDVWSACS